MHADGRPFGTMVTRISRDTEAWSSWYKDNQARFDPNLRYRNGKPFSLQCLLENLESERSPHQVRRLAYDELVMRYGMDVAFETDMPLAHQRAALARIAEWVQINSGKFKDGDWYFAGQLMPS